VTPETNEHLDKAREYLVKARNLLATAARFLYCVVGLLA